MKKFKNTSSLLLIACFLLFANMQCKKDDRLDADGLPRATQTGERIFACKVNGVNWISSTKSRDMHAYVDTETIRVWGTLYKAEYFESFKIEIKDLQNVMQFSLNGKDDQYAFYSSNKDCFNSPGGYGIGDAKSSDGEVTFTRIDSVAKIISGTFWCNIPTDKCDTLRITDGRFDIRYY